MTRPEKPVIKRPEELQAMRESGKLLASTFEALADLIKPGVTTRELDSFVENYIALGGGRPSFKGYNGFPAAICASPDEVVVHGIPGDRPLVEGQIIGIDIGVELRGWHSDSARTYAVGQISREAKRLMEVTKQALEAGIAQAVVGAQVGDIGEAVQAVVEQAGYSVVRDLVGHGIGRQLHEAPEVPNYKARGRSIRLEAGMAIAIEPMVNEGGWQVQVGLDGWTIRTKDGKLSAHFEHTVAITEEGPWVLTR